MIDLDAERLIEWTDAPREIQRLTGGAAPHPKTVKKWMRVGLRGIRLESARIGQRTFTSLEALQRWADRLAEAAVQDAGGTN